MRDHNRGRDTRRGRPQRGQGSTVPSDGRLEKLWNKLHAEDQQTLQMVRRCASLSLPHILPPEGRLPDGKVPVPYQARGAKMVRNLTGAARSLVWPVDRPWLQVRPAAAVRQDQNIPPEDHRGFESLLQGIELIIQAKLESMNPEAMARGRTVGFHVVKNMAFDQLHVTGDTLEHMDDDFRLRLFGRNSYVTRRDQSGFAYLHMTHEKIDPLSLDEDLRKAAELSDMDESESATDRMTPLITKIEWQPISRNWLIEQEVNGRVIKTMEEKVTPYFSTTYSLSESDNYGRGFIEEVSGVLMSYDKTTEHLLDFAAMAADNKPVLDASSLINEDDLTAPTGTILRGRVSNDGRVEGIGHLRFEKLPDFSVVQAVWAALGQELDQISLSAIDAFPNQDRVTRLQVAHTIREIQQRTGGQFALVMDMQQRPLIERAWVVAKKKGLIPTNIPDELIELEISTGINALQRELEVEQMLTALAMAAQAVGPDVIQREINTSDVTRHILSIGGGPLANRMLKTEEQKLQEAQHQLALQAQAQATQQTIETAGAVAEKQLTEGAN